MKVGIITIYRKNYGAFLQAYALQQTLLKIGCESEIIRYDYYRDHTCFGVAMASNPSFKILLKVAIVEIVRFIPHRRRLKVFDKSVAVNIRESKEYYREYAELEKNPPKYDVYLTGSDQVFNPRLSPQAFPARTLQFVKEGLKVSYAASAGADRIPDEYSAQFREAISTFNKVSVREEGLKNFFETHYAKETERHIDPVFLLDKQEWTTFSKPVAELPKEYIFYYRVLPQKELNRIAQKVSEETGLPIFVADGHDSFKNQIKRKGFLSPEQWVYAINHATYVITNSFHGASFSINLEKRTSILVPSKGGERVTDLLKKCEMDFMIDNPLYMLENLPFDYTSANRYIKEERKRGVNYLNETCLYCNGK